jgi:hypothetical protein
MPLIAFTYGTNVLQAYIVITKKSFNDAITPTPQNRPAYFAQGSE